jgi:hypothetical protein
MVGVNEGVNIALRSLGDEVHPWGPKSLLGANFTPWGKHMALKTSLSWSHWVTTSKLPIVIYKFALVTCDINALFYKKWISSVR